MRRIRFVATLVAIALVAAGCGGGSDDDASTDGTSTSAAAATSEVPSDVAAAAQAIADEWGGPDGVGVLVLSVDAGYSVEQILDHPELAADGTIDGVEPDGAPIGAVGPPPADGESQGVLRPIGYEAGSPPRDAYIDFIGDTAGELFEAAKTHLASQPSGLDPSLTSEVAVLQVLLMLLTRGYTLEQVVEGVILGSVDASGFPCVSIEDDPPVVPAGPDRVRIESDMCPPLPGGSGATTSAPGATTPTTTAGGGSGDGDRFVGSVDQNAMISNGEALMNEVDLVAGDDLQGTIVLLLEGSIVAGTTGIDCFYVQVTFAPGAVPSTGDGTYAGTVEAAAAFPDGACPGGGPPSGTETSEGTVTVTISGDTLTGVAGDGPDDPNGLAFTATRAD